MQFITYLATAEKLTGTASSSSTLDDNVASRAIDGDLTNTAATETEELTWIRLEFQNLYRVLYVMVYYRVAANPNGLGAGEWKVRVGRDPYWKKNVIYGKFDNNQPGTPAIKCDGLVLAKYVFVQRKLSEPKRLFVHEIIVYGATAV